MDGIAWAASAMVAARTRLEIATENLANVSTEGFRRILARGSLTARGVTIARQPAGEHPPLRETTGRTLLQPQLSNGVDAIAEMIDVLAAERSFESAQKAVAAIDLTRQKSAEAARIT
jgi:flagellar basal body rod protein FlgG